MHDTALVKRRSSLYCGAEYVPHNKYYNSLDMHTYARRLICVWDPRSILCLWHPLIYAGTNVNPCHVYYIYMIGSNVCWLFKRITHTTIQYSENVSPRSIYVRHSNWPSVSYVKIKTKVSHRLHHALHMSLYEKSLYSAEPLKHGQFYHKTPHSSPVRVR